MGMNSFNDCLIPLAGANNFRDMGGIATADGRKVKRGLLYRAAELTGLTLEDKKNLEQLGLKYIFDYRRDSEAELKPDPVIGSAVLERVPVFEDDNLTANMLRDGGREYYLRFTTDLFHNIYSAMPIGNRSYKRLMELLKEPEKNLPLVHHCTGGRDRTGVGAMLILLTLGVPLSSVMEDYLYSNVALKAYHEKIFVKASAFFTKEEAEAFMDAFPLRETYLQQAMESIHREYGSFEDYLLHEHGINQELRVRIQDYCLESSQGK